jgi:hypothetical protein
MKRVVVGLTLSVIAFAQSGDARFAALAIVCALLLALWPVPWQEAPMTEPAIEMNYDLDIELAEEGIRSAPPVEEEVTCSATWHLFAHRLAARCPDCGGKPNVTQPTRIVVITEPDAGVAL